MLIQILGDCNRLNSRFFSMWNNHCLQFHCGCRRFSVHNSFCKSRMRATWISSLLSRLFRKKMLRRRKLWQPLSPSHDMIPSSRDFFFPFLFRFFLPWSYPLLTLCHLSASVLASLLHLTPLPVNLCSSYHWVVQKQAGNKKIQMCVMWQVDLQTVISARSI